MIRFRRAAVMLAAVVVVALCAPLMVFSAVGTAAAQGAPVVVINEFLASNDTGLLDNTGQAEDWVELYNTGSSTVVLDGWQIADSGATFTFSGGVSIPAGDYLVVFASDDELRTTPTEVHLPFRLNRDGDSLTLRDPDGVLSDPSWPMGYPTQITDSSFGLQPGGVIGFFETPTPGAVNGAGAGGVVEPVTFSIDHGFYSGTQTIVLDSPTPGVTIRYTTDGSTPSATVGTIIAQGQSVAVSQTTTIRAIAYRGGWIDSPVETRSYLFTADIITQSGVPAGWPSDREFNNQRMDYGMDPAVVTGNEVTVSAALQSIPTLSIVTDLDNLFDVTEGIYVNAGQRGSDWERQASVELIDPSGAEAGFDIEAGIRMRGGFSRSANNPKHSLRIFFGDDYESALDYPLFGTEGDDRFEKVDLRTSQNFGWHWRRSTEASFMDELWSRDTQGAMGQPYTRSRQYHVYLNGQYWGIYMTQERVSGEYGESYFGGDEDDYDVVKRSQPGRAAEATNGTIDAWKSLFPLVSDLDVTDVEYAQLDAEVDLVSLADYYLLHFFTGDYDGSPSYYFASAEGRYGGSNNWYAIRNRSRVGDAAKWTFFDHDSEHSLCANNGPQLRENVDNTPPWNMVASEGDDFMAPAWLHEALASHPTYQQLFADRVQMHMIDSGGALTVAEANTRLDVRVAELTGAIEAESARWGDGDGSADPAYGRAEWNNGVQLHRDCFTDRQTIVEAQLRADGLWPTGEPPVIAPADGAVAYGAPATIDDLGQGGATWYTLDGSDPRALDGSVSASAVQYTGAVPINADLVVTARVLIAGEWSPLAEASYVLAAPPVPPRMILNEYNGVAPANYLGGGGAGDTPNGTDSTLGRVAGNGGDWLEFVVIEDGLDITGWTFEVWDSSGGTETRSASLTLTGAPLLSDLMSGTIVTISEDIADDVAYNPRQGDWTINLQANDAGDGQYVTTGTETDFTINNSFTQVAIFDAAGVPVALRTGEGTAPSAGVNSTEVFALQAPPASTVTPDSVDYDDGTTSTWGLPNLYDAGASTQDLSALRVPFGDPNCSGHISIADAIVIAQYTVGIRSDAGSCPLGNGASQINEIAGDVDGNGSASITDAILITQCTAGIPNIFCP